MEQLIEKSRKKLEYEKVIAKLAEQTSFAISREKALALLPADSIHEVRERLAETDEARELLRLNPLFSIGGVRDIRDHLRMAEIGGILEPHALLDIADTCRAGRLTKNYFSELKGPFPRLAGLGRDISLLKTIESGVEKAIADDGEIRDEASERLSGIRRRQRIAGERIKSRLDDLIRNPLTAKLLMEPIVTMRDGRYVVPVKQECRPQLPGVVHDISASGASVFVEPMAVLELNNELQALAKEEAAEIQAILRGLTMMVSGFSAELSANLQRLAMIDFIIAKGKLSHLQDGSAVKISEDGPIRLRHARHPLLPAAKVVPIDVVIEREVAAIVVTGPNTGGKTVSLKTVGLLTLMALAGLHIPADAGSELRFFRSIYADIGDEQSIEQSLSTFSSHMSNIVRILEFADNRSLVLLDELGAGTDPAEGAALAQSILSDIASRGGKLVATTHYSELKAFAANRPDFINASVEFDVETLSPTYRLLIGVPGKSNAFEIGRRLGLPERIIGSAAECLSSQDAQVAELLANLEDLRREAAASAEEAAKERAELQQQLAEVGSARQKMAAEAAEVRREALEEAQKIINSTREKSRTLYKEMQRQEQEKKNSDRAWQEAQRKLKSWQEQLEEELPPPVYAEGELTSIKVGDYVSLPRMKKSGYVLTEPDNGEVMLQIGLLKLKVAVKDLRPAAEAEPQEQEKKKRHNTMAMQKAKSISTELNLVGQDTLTAADMLEKYLDDAFVGGLKQVRIIHGKGSGALRNAVQEQLKKHRLVKEYRFGDYNEGGIGCTVVTLDS